MWSMRWLSELRRSNKQFKLREENYSNKNVVNTRVQYLHWVLSSYKTKSMCKCKTINIKKIMSMLHSIYILNYTSTSKISKTWYFELYWNLMEKGVLTTQHIPTFETYKQNPNPSLTGCVHNWFVFVFH